MQAVRGLLPITHCVHFSLSHSVRPSGVCESVSYTDCLVFKWCLCENCSAKMTWMPKDFSLGQHQGIMKA